MRLKFIPPSDKELEDSYNYYKNQLAGLGDQFLTDFNKAVKLLP